MQFALGMVAGISLTTMVIMVLLYFRAPLEKKVTIIEKRFRSMGPRPTGFIVEPPSDAEESRERVIRENDEKGKDTKISDLT